MAYKKYYVSLDDGWHDHHLDYYILGADLDEARRKAIAKFDPRTHANIRSVSLTSKTQEGKWTYWGTLWYYPNTGYVWAHLIKKAQYVIDPRTGSVVSRTNSDAVLRREGRYVPVSKKPRRRRSCRATSSNVPRKHAPSPPRT